MLVTFKCRNFHDVVTTGDVGIALLKAMGETGRVPGALTGANVATARANLAAAMAGPQGERTPGNDDVEEDENDEEAPTAISLRKRALPLLDLLAAASAEDLDVMWE